MKKLRQTLESDAVFLITRLHGESGLEPQGLQSQKHVNARDEDFYRCSFLALHASDREA